MKLGNRKILIISNATKTQREWQREWDSAPNYIDGIGRITKIRVSESELRTHSPEPIDLIYMLLKLYRLKHGVRRASNP